MELCLREKTEQGLSDEELREGLIQLLNEHPAKRVLILPPDYTRYHSKAGFLTNVCYHYYTDYGAEVDILPTLARKYPDMSVLLTLGKRGAICVRGGESAKSGIYPVKVVDTTAAGDTFLGYFLAEVLDGKSLSDALALATVASSMCVQVMGAADSVPLRKDALSAMQRGLLGNLGEWGGWR